MRLNFGGHRVLILGGSCTIGLALIDLLGETSLEIRATHASDTGQAALIKHCADIGRTSPRLDLSDSTSVDALDCDVSYVIDLAQARFEALVAGNTEADAYFMGQIAGRQRLLRRLGRAMLSKRFGRLVYVSSTAASLPSAGQGFYSATKRASEALYQTLGLELAPRGVTTVNLRLGLLDCGRGAEFLNQTRHREMPKTPLPTVEQVASTLLFLLSDQGLAFSSTTLTMDAGLTAHKYA